MDGDGLPSVADAIAILRIVVGLDDNSPTADVDADGQAGANDAIAVLRCVVGLDPWPIVDEVPSETELEAMDAVTTTLSGMVDAALAEQPVRDAMASVAAQASTMDGVDAAWATANSVAIKHTGGGIDVWLQSSLLDDGRASEAIELCSAGPTQAYPEEYVGNARALVVQQVAGIESWAYHVAPVVEQVIADLRDAGFAVDRWVGSEVTLATLKGLSPYGIIVLEGHGGASLLGEPGLPIGPSFAFQTGERVGSITEHWTDWVRGRICQTSINGGPWVWCVTENFFRAYYADGALHDSLVYMASCNSLKNDELARVMHDLGAHAYVGWSDSVDRTCWDAALSLFRGMRCGQSLGAAFDGLDPALKSDDNAQLRIYPESGRSLQLTDYCPRDPEPPPDPDDPLPGTIAFTLGREYEVWGRWEWFSHVCTIRPDGTGFDELTDGLVHDMTLCWSPDGTKIVFRRFHEEDWEQGTDAYDTLHIYDVPSSSVSAVSVSGCERIGAAAWSPDGRYIAVQGWKPDSVEDNIWLVDVTNWDSALFTSGSGFHTMTAQPWSRDSQTLAIEEGWGGYSSVHLQDIDRVSWTAIPGFYETCGGAWCSQRDEIAFEGRQSSSDARQTWVTDPLFKTARALTAGDRDYYRPLWSPDGELLALESVSPTDSFMNAIWVIGAGGTGLRCLVDMISLNGDVSWSPDSRAIAFTAYDAPYDGLCLVRTPTGAAIKIAGGEGRASAAAWSPQ